ncbi:cytochrome P450 [Schizopora paradoxa]|uniref:Cytochrome P450 n=1 Tax=Schizopora paradoxa TaxID=27342 RepID=A0A0H2R3D6_9AGAM|nr:cytochrome P450 [Schizopora paradoxa]
MTIQNILLGGLILFVLKQIVERTYSKQIRLPPGPKRKPLIGNLLDLPKGEFDWIHWLRHKDLYGPISSVTVFGQHIVILNDVKLAVDLLDKNSSVFSDRPALVFCGEMCGWNRSLAMMHYGPQHKAIRKIVHQFMGSGDAISRHHPLLEVESRRFLLRTLKNPGNVTDHIRTLTGAVILKLAHGYTIEPEKPDPLVKLGDDTLFEFSLSAQAGTWLVDLLPFLQYLPDWFPGTGFKHIAKKFRSNSDEMAELPHAFVKKQMKSGQYYPSLTSSLLEESSADDDEYENNVKWSAVAVYGGGADTTVSANCSFYLAMALYPEVQRRAQEEIDRVVGTDRLPTYQDRKNLPYVDALIKETLRWHPVLPLGLPHASSEDSVVDGYTIPKGTIMLANIWQFTHDPARYHEPAKFNPERFLGKNPEPDSYDNAFGFGRRICPGKELADAILFVSIAQSLAAFNIGKAIDANGNEITPAEDYTNGIISRPNDFECSIKPRSDKVASLIKAVEDEHPFEPSNSADLLELDWKAT